LQLRDAVERARDERSGIDGADPGPDDGQEIVVKIGERNASV
jgi:hypothetical protein